MAASSFIQSNTSKGRVVKTPAAVLTGKEGTLVSLQTGSSGIAPVNTTGAGARADFVVLEAGTSVSATTDINDTTSDLGTVVCLPLTCDQQVRVIATSAIGGGVAVQSDSSGQAVPASSGNWVFGITEESAVANQYVLVRPNVYKM
jgi:hypothetical protein